MARRPTPYERRHADLIASVGSVRSEGAAAQEAAKLVEMRCADALTNRRRAEEEVLRGLSDRRDATRRDADEAARELQDLQLRVSAVPGALKTIYRDINQLVHENLAEALAYALEAERRVKAAFLAAVEAVDEIDQVAARELPRIDALRPIPPDGIMINAGALIVGEIAAARATIAGLTIRWPRDVDPERGALNLAHERQQGVARAQAERDTAFKNWSGDRS